MNTTIIKMFEDLVSYIQDELDNEEDEKKITANKFRLKNNVRVLSIMKKYPSIITLDNYMELKDVDGIGKGSLDRIKEILETGKLSELKGFVNTKKDMKNSLEELELVVGIGRSKALELYDMGITTVKMLKEKIKNKEIEVNDKILLGLKYYGKYYMNIPRSEMELYEKFFARFIRKINKSLKLDESNEYIFELCGSYRREKHTSNDIDILITKKGTTIEDNKYNHLLRIVDKLKKPMKMNNDKPLLVDSMTDKKIKTKYMGFSKLWNNLVRRIDIRFIPYSSYYTALLYFTGSSELNQKMRQIAKKKNYKLSEYGLYDSDGNSINIKSERDIFKKLEMEFLPPRLR